MKGCEEIDHTSQPDGVIVNPVITLMYTPWGIHKRDPEEII